MQTKKRLGVMLLLMLVLLVVASGCGAGKSNSGGDSLGSGGSNTPTEAPTETPEEEGPALLGPDKHPVVTVELSNGKTVKLELYPEVAPNTVNNFVSLVQKGFYDGLTFHRVIPGFMVQGGDPEGTGMGGPGYGIAGEFTENGFENKLKHTRGVLSMARAQDPDSAGSQFFIMVEDYPSLDNKYASFGKVMEGMEAVDEIVNQTRDANDKPLPTTDENGNSVAPITMKKLTVDTRGMTFEEPKKAE